jgi:hypothetical protein
MTQRGARQVLGVLALSSYFSNYAYYVTTLLCYATTLLRYATMLRYYATTLRYYATMLLPYYPKRKSHISEDNAEDVALPALTEVKTTELDL